MANRFKLVFFGATNQLSLAAFEALLESGVAPLAVIVAAESAGRSGIKPLEPLLPAAPVGELPLLNRYHKPTLIEAAWSAGVPLFALSDPGHPALRDLLTSLAPDAAFVACFPRRLPTALISLPPLGFLNVHPSLLPQYRGPAPLFWLFQKNEFEHRGVTVHKMDEGFDTGPLVRQEPVSFADGLTQPLIERQCGRVGGQLLLEATDLLASGRPARPQPGKGSYYPWPAAPDYRLQATWPAQRAFNFMRATNGSSTPYPLTLAGKHLSLSEALAVDPQGQQDTPVHFDGSVARLQFSPGIVTARLTPI